MRILPRQRDRPHGRIYSTNLLNVTLPPPRPLHHPNSHRTKLAQITVDPVLLNSPPFSTLRRAAASSSNGSSSSLQQQIIVDVLSEPANVSQVEVVIDEIAELVRSHAFACRIEEGVVAKFRPFAQSGADL